MGMLVSPLPTKTFPLPPRLAELIELRSLSSLIQFRDTTTLPAWSLRVDVFKDLATAPFEELCMALETWFAQQDLLCECCQKPKVDRCTWCLQACGWHRCQHRCRERHLTLSCIGAFRWKPYSLYHLRGHDVDAAIFDMLRRSDSQGRITKMLTNLEENGLLTHEHYEELLRLVLANINAVVDADPILAPPEQNLSLSHAELEALSQSPEYIRAKLDAVVKRMQRYWDASTASYRSWQDFEPKRPVPTQYLAYRAILKRMECPMSFFIALVAPAGFGKTELLTALRLHCALHGITMTCLAVTGVAAAQNAGSTVHSFLYLNHDNEARILQSEAGRRRLGAVQLLVVDEAMMGECDLILLLRDICCEVPLTVEFRRPGALAEFGYRDVILCGDIRQLPPASGKQPFWGCDSFQEVFEIFTLAEDRRHEKDIRMQRLKELFAWGGCCPPQRLQSADDLSNLTSPWPVHEEVLDFIAAGYLRGWGITGNNVDLDKGTALFPKRVDVRNWNDACVNQIEDTFGTSCQAVDIAGADPFTAKADAQPDKRLMHGIQTLPLLRLRTHPQHRMRVMLLHNLNVSKGWVNGARARLLSKFSWTGEPKSLQRNGEQGPGKPKWIVDRHAYIDLQDEHKHPEFNIKVVKDEEFILKKTVRFNDSHVAFVPVRTDEATINGTKHAWRQSQAVPAYALTVHKAQGLTMMMVFLAFSKVFGFGLAYTALTRCPYEWATLLVGVPPKDVLAMLLKKDASGLTKIDQKREEIKTLLEDENAFAAHVQARIDCGEFDLNRIAQEFSDAGPVDAAMQTARQRVAEHIRRAHEDWTRRLEVDTGITAMLTVSSGFKRDSDTGVTTYANQQDNWQSLAEAFQIDAETRQRILFYREVAVEWMNDPAVNALAGMTLEDFRLPTRVAKTRSVVQNYAGAPRPSCPKPPPGFTWGAHASDDMRNLSYCGFVSV